MPTHSLVWTALPNGLSADGAQVRLSLLCAPRLEPAGAPARLDTFRDLLDWPATLATATIVVRLGTRTLTVAASHRDAAIGVPHSPTWRALFAPGTFVRDHAVPDRTGHAVLSYDTVAMHELVRGVYASLAAKGGDDLPTLDQLHADEKLTPIIAAVRGLDRALTDHATGLRKVAEQFERFRKDRRGLQMKTETEAQLARFQLFHTPPSAPLVQRYTKAQVGENSPLLSASWREHALAALPTGKELVERIDFHQIVSAMNQYPVLLRRLGLVVDLLLPRGAFLVGADQALSVSVTIPSTVDGKPIPSMSLRTRTRLSATAFGPVPRPDPDAAELRVRDGLLRTDDGRIHVLQADVDGAGHKLMNFARTLSGAGPGSPRLDAVSKHDRRAGAPALRTAGLMLVQRQRGEQLGLTFTRTWSRDGAVRNVLANAIGAVAPDLWAEDLVRGWRVDVWDGKTQRWRSLCERVADYVVGADDAQGKVALPGVREEGTVRLAATTSSDPTSNADVVYLHETLTTWQGWSLVARQPGLAIDRDDQKGSAAPEVPPGVRLSASFVARPGSLPRLRYGRTYAMRARVVDLAGNSLPPRATDYGTESPATQARPFLRYEPLQPPVLALRRRADGTLDTPAAGESMERLAIRTFNEQFDDPAPSGERAFRRAVPPRVSVREAELHGALDAAGAVNPGAYAMLAARDREMDAVQLEIPGPLAEPGEPVAPATYAVLGEKELAPYLPDPLCTHVAARFFRHPLIASSAVIEIPLYPPGASWPDAAPFTIEVYERDGGIPRFEEATRRLLVPTPKATRAKLRLSAMATDAARGVLGVWHWLPADVRTARAGDARWGKMWAITPWRTIDIVHATQRPLRRPDILDLSMARSAGATAARPRVVARCGITSTDRVELHARWNDPRDAAASGPANTARTDRAYAIKVTDGATYLLPSDGTDRPDHTIPEPDTVAFGAGVKQVAERTHEFGDTRYRRVEYHVQATTRFREYLPGDLQVETLPEGTRRLGDPRVSVSGAPARTWVPSTAPPPAPDVLYVVPTFAWTRGTDADGNPRSHRRGGGLRVYLDRPWNASGYGEMLAVVLPPAGAAVDPDGPLYKQAVTQWGNDPAWRSAFVAGTAPAAASFSRRRTASDPSGKWLPPQAPAVEADQPVGPFVTTGLRHPALPPHAQQGLVDVAPHDVTWDPDRRLWFCDVEIRPGEAYWPFVRLALARYQPVSVHGTHLSTVVLADFMTLAPDRWLSVVPVSTAPLARQLRVFGFGPTESAGHAEATTSEQSLASVVPAATTVVEAWVERLNAALGTDFGWERVEAATARTVTASEAVYPAGEHAPAPASVARLESVAERTAVGTSTLQQLIPAPMLWSGVVTLPTQPSATTRYRAVVAEYEEYLADDAAPYGAPVTAKARRMVYTEHVELR